jgi:hypothetical protein
LKSVIYLQNAIRRWSVEKMFDKALRRQSVANELLQTEENYVANLSLLIDVFAKPLQDSVDMAQRAANSSGDMHAMEPIVTESQIRTLFSSANVLLQFQSVFLRDLRQKVEHWHYQQTIGSILTQMTPFMRLYAEYVGNYSESSQLYQRLISKRDGNARFKAFLECAYQSPSIMAVGDLDSFLVQPVQRLPRYKMFLEQLLKLTPANHDDKEPLQMALQKVSDVVYYVNEKKRSHDLELQVFIAYGKIEPPVEDLLAPGRALLLEGPLHFTKSLKEPRVLCQGFLFSDLLIIAKVPSDDKKRYKFLARFDLRTLSLGTIFYHHPDATPRSQTELRSSSSSSITSSVTSVASKVDNASPNSNSKRTPVHTPQSSTGSVSSMGLNNSSPSIPRSSSHLDGGSRLVSAKEPCFFLESRHNGQYCAWCWADEDEANKWREALENAAEKLHLARETIPSTSEGKAHAFKSSITKHYVTSSLGTPVATTSLIEGISPDHRPTNGKAATSSSPIPEASTHSSSPSSNSPAHLKSQSTPILSSSPKEAQSSQNPSSATPASSDAAPAPQRQLRKFAERRRELGI